MRSEVKMYSWRGVGGNVRRKWKGCVGVELVWVCCPDSEIDEVKGNSSDRLRRVRPLSHAASNGTLVTDKVLVVVSISSCSVVPANGGTNHCDSNTRVS